jgi:hypothetical protein
MGQRRTKFSLNKIVLRVSKKATELTRLCLDSKMRHDPLLRPMVVHDLLGPAGGQDEEFDQREDHVYGRYLVGLLAPKAVKIQREELDELGTDEQDDAESGKSDKATLPAGTFFPNSFGLSFVIETGAKAFLIRTNWGALPSNQERSPNQPADRRRGYVSGQVVCSPPDIQLRSPPIGHPQGCPRG